MLTIQNITKILQYLHSFSCIYLHTELSFLTVDLSESVVNELKI